MAWKNGMVRFRMEEGVGKVEEIARVQTREMAVHRAAYFEKAFYEEGYAMAESFALDDQVESVGGVVNHHLLAKQFVADFFRHLSRQEPSVIVVVSPDHFARGRGDISVSYAKWETPFGDILPADEQIFDAVVKAHPRIIIDEGAFDKEHGVRNLVGFVKYSLPETKLITALVRQDAKKDVVNAFIHALVKSLPKDAVVIASVDFSHYLPQQVAEGHDAFTFAALQNGDFGWLAKAEVDSPQSLQTASGFALAREAGNFLPMHRGNSAEFSRDTFATTSYVVGRYVAGEVVPMKYGSVMAFGDVIVGEDECRDVQKMMGIVPEIARGVGLATVRIAEVDEGCNVNGKNGFGLLNSFFVRSGVSVVDPRSSNDSRVMVNGNLRIATVVVHDDGSDEVIEDGVAEVRGIRERVDRVVVYVVWKNWKGEAREHEKEMVRGLVDAGVDVVIGFGGKVGEVVEYAGRPVVYSLGTMVGGSEGESLGVMVEFFATSIRLRKVPLLWDKERVTIRKEINEEGIDFSYE